MLPGWTLHSSGVLFVVQNNTEILSSSGSGGVGYTFLWSHKGIIGNFSLLKTARYCWRIREIREKDNITYIRYQEYGVFFPPNSVFWPLYWTFSVVQCDVVPLRDRRVAGWCFVFQYLYFHSRQLSNNIKLGLDKMARDLRNPDIEIKLTKSRDNKGEEQGLEGL